MSTQPQYAVGIIVKLKSGGPEMTIQKANKDVMTHEFTGSYKCQWFAGKKLEDGIFPEDSLELVKPEAKGV
ncbi:DUF2158 domain-containing protein [Lampropedia puyangensis]|uniref:DUF2158 domain-containing protein n=1 Tax=Lampropedia puyangensis TaxID=1330072 RepID=A0A4S8EUH6_9BURK|nr:DUF2158 domain-containing protein [Lampropedia puyangensis]THT96071.1 DUF2158 domain-containing protein [Lampropedia puyangensis]